jgi:hypothetical protein
MASRRTLRLLICACGSLLLSAVAHAATPSDLAATSSSAAKEEAERAIPWKALSHSDQRTVHYVLRKASLYRRMPTKVVDCDPEAFTFLEQRPEVVVEIWNRMGISQLTLERQDDNTFLAKDGAGATGVIRVMHAEYGPGGHNTMVLYADGEYQAAPLPQPVKARTVLLMRSGSTTETNGRDFMTARLDAFVDFDQVAADLCAKTIQPLIVRVADHNFTETMKFVSNFSHTAEENPAGLSRLARDLKKCDDPTKERMVEVVQQVSTRYAKTTSPSEIRLASGQQAEDTAK